MLMICGSATSARARTLRICTLRCELAPQRLASTPPPPSLRDFSLMTPPASNSDPCGGDLNAKRQALGDGARPDAAAAVAPSAPARREPLAPMHPHLRGEAGFGAGPPLAAAPRCRPRKAAALLRVRPIVDDSEEESDGSDGARPSNLGQDPSHFHAILTGAGRRRLEEQPWRAHVPRGSAAAASAAAGLPPSGRAQAQAAPAGGPRADPAGGKVGSGSASEESESCKEEEEEEEEEITSGRGERSGRNVAVLRGGQPARAKARARVQASPASAPAQHAGRQCTSRFTGVSRVRRRGGAVEWLARKSVTLEGSREDVKLGKYKTEVEAALVYDAVNSVWIDVHLPGKERVFCCAQEGARWSRSHSLGIISAQQSLAPAPPPSWQKLLRP